MDGHLEPLAAVLRVGGAYGEPYTWAATVRYHGPTTVELLGVVRAPTLREVKAAKRVLAEAGITDVFVLRDGLRRHLRVRRSV